MIKLIPPTLDFRQVESAELSTDTSTIPLIFTALRLHHFAISDELFNATNSIKLHVKFKTGEEKTFVKQNKYKWVYDRILADELRMPFKTNASSIYNNTKEDKQIISDLLNQKYLEATNSTIGTKGNRNLLYYSVGGNKEYFELLKQSITSIFSKASEINFDVLFICPESWIVDIEAVKPTNAIFKYHIIDDTTDGVEISKNKTKIFEFSEINKYNKILFIDADILASRDIKHIFAMDYNHEVLYVKHNSIRVPFSSHSGNYHGLNHLSNEQLEQMKVANQLPFNAGQFLFRNSNKMKKHFDNLNWLMAVWPGPYFFEQSFMNHYFCQYNLTDNEKFGKKVKLISTVEPHFYNPKINADNILVHFIAPALNATMKVNFIEEYTNAYFPQ